MAKIIDFDNLHRAVSERFPGQPIPGLGAPAATIHLYHAPNSICSQKVRAVLLQTSQPFLSHTIDIFKGESYDPDYVRLRMAGCEAASLPLADNHPGSTSVATTGCDACVVPTVVVTDACEVIVDSKNICIELDRRNVSAPNSLIPDKFRDAIAAELAIVDDLPNYQLLAVAAGKPSASAADNSFALSKVRRCDALIAANAEDTVLCRAYNAKRAKERAAADDLFDPSAMDRARRLIEAALGELETRLAEAPGPYLFGSSITMADLFWGVELIRIEDLGLAHLWSKGVLPAVDDYHHRLSELPAISGAVTDWRGARLKLNAGDVH